MAPSRTTAVFLQLSEQQKHKKNKQALLVIIQRQCVVYILKALMYNLHSAHVIDFYEFVFSSNIKVLHLVASTFLL